MCASNTGPKTLILSRPSVELHNHIVDHFLGDPLGVGIRDAGPFGHRQAIAGAWGSNRPPQQRSMAVP